MTMSLNNHNVRFCTKKPKTTNRTKINFFQSPPPLSSLLLALRPLPCNLSPIFIVLHPKRVKMCIAISVIISGTVSYFRKGHRIKAG
jgi:hypothetical protein